jgi:molybdopterin-guanine dinucleotide biosynthesis protein MobB
MSPRDEHRVTAPVVGITGDAGVGKTRLAEAIVAALAADGLRVACVKHTHHPLDLDRPGSDTARLRAAGAAAVVGHSPTERVVVTPTGGPAPDPWTVVAGLDGYDLVLVEGRHDAPWPVLHLHAPGRPPRPVAGPVLAELEIGAGPLPLAEALATLRALLHSRT